MLHLSFDGTNYHGWQVQANARTVQQTFQDAAEAVFQKRLDVTGCSRTDSGVHANDYVCIFKTDSAIECRSIMRALNANLPHDIAVTECSEANDDFHPRYSSKGKEYIYKIDNGLYRDPFLKLYSYYYPKKIDCELLDCAAKKFVGKHDFAAFCSAGSESGHRPDCTESDTVRTIFDAGVSRENNMVIFKVRGDGFLYNMVRIMTGTLLFVAQGKLCADDITTIIESKERKNAGATAPAKGLFLNRVFY
jgi:tRNA pseudouridine38-40 synthase